MFKCDPSEDIEYSGINILSQEVTLDLTYWQKLGDALRESIPASPAVWHYKIKAQKVKPKDVFYRELFTTGLTPNAVCLSHPFTFEKVPYTPEPGRPRLHKTLLTVDISNVDVDDKFDLEMLFVFWNGFQNTHNEWAVQKILYPTQEAIFTVIFPAHKIFTGFKTEKYLSNSNFARGPYSGTPPVGDTIVVKGDTIAAKITWNISDVQSSYSYRLTWDW